MSFLVGRWRDQWTARRAEFAAKVQAGQTMHGTCRSLSREEIVALYGDAPVAPLPPPSIVVRRPRVERRVVQLAPKPRPRPARGRESDSTLRARLLAQFIPTEVRTTAQCTAAIPGARNASVSHELGLLVRAGKLDRIRLGVYRLPGSAADVVVPTLPTNWITRRRIGAPTLSEIVLALLRESVTVSNAQIKAAAPEFTCNTIDTRLGKLVARGKLRRVARGVFALPVDGAESVKINRISGPDFLAAFDAGPRTVPDICTEFPDITLIAVRSHVRRLYLAGAIVRCGVGMYRRA